MLTLWQDSSSCTQWVVGRVHGPHLEHCTGLCQVLLAADTTLPAAQGFGYGGVQAPPSRVRMTLTLLLSLPDTVPNDRQHQLQKVVLHQ